MRKVALLALICALGPAVAEEPRPAHPIERPQPQAPPDRPWEPMPRHLPPPANLSPTVRAMLRERMARHGKSMTDLVQAVVMLDYDATARLAHEIAEEPRLARPLTRDATELNTTLPDRFFQLQDELHTRAARLSDVARSRNGAELSTAFGQLAETCVACHRVYSTGRAP